MDQLASQERPGSSRRRSQRVLLHVPVVVQRKTDSGPPFQEDTQTLVINAHGALITLATALGIGNRLVLVNKKAGDAQECRVVYVGAEQSGKTQVGVEFTEPAPHFWHIAFPPEDWSTLSQETDAPAPQ